MTSTLRAIIVAPALWAFALYGATPDATRKCRSTVEPGKYLIALDGVISEQKPGDNPIQNVNKDDIESIEVACLNPRDSTVTREAGIPIVIVWTKGAIQQLKGTLTAIVTAQDEQHRRTAKYASDIADLRLPATTAKLRISVEAGERGWIARGTMPLHTSTCVVFDGEPPGSPPSHAARTISCS